MQKSGDAMLGYSKLKFILVLSMLGLAGCERLGVADPVKEAAAREADARATGSACRHAGRGIEDCYALNPDAARAAVYAGWKEMNDYMRENNIAEIRPSAHASSASEGAASASESASASASASAK